MTEKDLVKTSKLLSFVLRHDPGSLGLALDEKGYLPVADLLHQLKIKKHSTVTLEDLKQVVEQDNKKRYAFNEDGTRIRASQGHSVEVNLGYTPKDPPDFLYHGTATRFTESIRTQGLLKQSRNHVHMVLDAATATTVGARHGSPHIFKVDTKQMALEGFKFFLSDNDVWLTEHVPARFLSDV